MMYVINAFKEIVMERKILKGLAINDYKARFASSGLGSVWAFLQPLLNILILWMVFEVGFRSSPVDDIPFIVWYIPAFLVWTYFSDALSQATNSFMEYSYLLKKLNFKAVIVPPMKILSCTIIHAFFIGFIIVINLFYKIFPTVYYLQVFYYLFSLIVFLLGTTWFLAAIAVFVKDVSNLVAVVLQLGFWATPLFWDPRTMDPVVQFILKFNPMYYICMGYRETFLYQVPFWEHPTLTLYFWSLTLIMLYVGTRTFQKLEKQFVDVI